MGCNRLLKTGSLFLVVNNIVEPELTMLNNIVDNIEQCCPNNIVAYCFQQLLIFGCIRCLRATNMASLYGLKCADVSPGVTL